MSVVSLCASFPLSMAVGLKAKDPLPTMYRDRWAGVTSEVPSARTVPLYGPPSVEEILQDEEACITVGDENSDEFVCGTMSFDSTGGDGEGMVCVEQEGRWYCK